MITTNFSLRRGRRREAGTEGGTGGRKKILCDPDRLHKSALFKWANIIWSAALWSIIPDSYPSRERGINHQAKLFSSVHPPPQTHAHTYLHGTYTCIHTHFFSLYITPIILLSIRRASSVVPVFFACPVKCRTMLRCNHFKWLCASISVIGFRSSLEREREKN